jgi:molybdopterin synthase catalytic subunit
MIAIVNRAIDVDGVRRSVLSPSAGGIDIFIGTTRNHSDGRKVLSLEYEAYEPMAIAVLNKIERTAREKWPIENIAIVHRIGKVEIGEASVVIAVSAVHRREAFEACRWAIDTLKKDAPIWKKEQFDDGAAWVVPAGD